METKKILVILFGIIYLTVLSCSDKNSPDNIADDKTPENLIRLSTEQMIQANIITGRIQKELISETIYCRGTIEAAPNQQAYVSVPLNGYIKKIMVRVGEYVKKDQVLAILEHPDYIDLQREFLEAESEYKYFKEDFKRQGELSLENATSLKIMQAAQNEFSKIEARFYALKEHLEFIGINTDSLFVDRIKSSIPLKAPISGYITKSEGNIGQFCTTEIPVFQIISNTNAILHLIIFESDAWKIENGQNIEFSTIQDQNKNYKATIMASTKSVDENNTISLNARITGIDKNLLPGMYVKAKIIVKADSVFAVNNQSIVKINKSTFIFVKKDSNGFAPREVEIGRTTKEYSEIVPINSDLLEAEIVFSGSYYLQSALKEE